MITAWTVVRFLHIIGAMLWVGGQLAVSLVVRPLAARSLDDKNRATMLTAVGKRFGVLTMAVFLPIQLITGTLLAWGAGVTWESLAEPGYGRILVAKLLLFCLVMAAASSHGIASSKGHPTLARVLALTSVFASVGVVLVAVVLGGA
ncbi:DUF2269 family protein [Nocardiopsis algeriensis]|uniref:Putative membrane protein n=1 Tax=Nocardiopsis algeriensis TaxID=1478215 RepID=A0A841IZH0_9ACTN|nr:DUF2269 family protein [Nocardiopsis algeriensis]MBB6121658.1 putative membrane protein [Nocardiopsis algeriensis]